MEVAWGLRLDLDIAFDFTLAGESHFVFVTNVSKEGFRVSAELRCEVFNQARFRDVGLSFFDIDAARAAQTETRTVQELVETFVNLHACLAGGSAKICTLGNVDGFFLFDKRDLRHGPQPSMRVLMPEMPGHSLVDQPETDNLPATERRMVRPALSSFQTTFQVPISEKLAS